MRAAIAESAVDADLCRAPAGRAADRLMRGLLVVAGTQSADARDVGEAVASALERQSLDAAVTPVIALGGSANPHAFDAAASPLTAARLTRTELRPARLVDTVRERAGETAVVAVADGLLAPITQRYAVRDLALDLGLPVVLALPAGPDAVNLGRLMLEAARGAGLAVAAIVLTGWPDAPDRILLDERQLLGELTGVAVVVLPRAGDRDDLVRAWPVAEWLDAAPAAADARGQTPVKVLLEPYDEWQARPVGDPRSTPRPTIMQVLFEIVAVEGPIRAGRAYGLYNRAAGGKKLTSAARAPLASAAYWLSRERKIVLTPREDIPWQEDDLLRAPDAPTVRVRELGPRTLEEVPLDEIAELMRRLGLTDDAALKRAVLSAYGLVRLTARADEYLALALGLRD
jgi:dethiobiotin synthetase